MKDASMTNPPIIASDAGKTLPDGEGVGARVANRQSRERETWVQFYQRMARLIP